MKAAARLLVGEPIRLAVTAVGLAACGCLAAFGPHDFAVGLGVSSAMAGLTVIIAILGGAAASATEVAPSNKETRP
ncbi:hypothetical protein ACRAWG_32525 [Methylobacterium sp. P31]